MSGGVVVGALFVVGAVALLRGALVARALRRRRAALRDAAEIDHVAQAFDVNPADAEILAEIALLGGPTNPTLAATDRRTFDSGSALYLIRIFLEGGDVWNSVLALARLRERLGFEGAKPRSPLPEFLGRVTVTPVGSKNAIVGVVVDRRGAVRLVVPTLPEGRLSPGELVELRTDGSGEPLSFRVAAIEPKETGVTLDLQPLSASANSPRVQTLLPVTVRRTAPTDTPPLGEATILDLSTGGACVRVTAPLEKEERVSLSFHLNPATPIEVEGTVVWTAPAGSGRWRAGVRFDGASAAVRREILAVLSIQQVAPGRRDPVPAGVAP